MNILKLFKKRSKPKVPEITVPLERYEIVLSGSGGQGIVLAGKILAEACAIYDGKEAVMTQSYGPEARGGASRTEIIVGSTKIDYPRVMRVDVLLAMTQQALDTYAGLLDSYRLLIIDETFIKEIPPRFKNVFKAPFSGLALKIFNAPIVANIIALGALAALTQVVAKAALIRALLERVPDKVLVLDRVSVDMGFKVVKDSNFQWRSA